MQIQDEFQLIKDSKESIYLSESSWYSIVPRVQQRVHLAFREDSSECVSQSMFLITIPTKFSVYSFYLIFTIGIIFPDYKKILNFFGHKPDQLRHKQC